MVKETGPNEDKTIISNLRPYSHYVLSVTVFNKKGEGPPSEPVAFKTPEGGKNNLVVSRQGCKKEHDKVIGQG